jgi:hypothetical protein
MTVSIGVAQLGPSTSPLHIRLRSLDSGGELGVVELEMAPGSEGPPLHVHPTHGEGFYGPAHPAHGEAEYTVSAADSRTRRNSTRP